jgi:hypothetical protein
MYSIPTITSSLSSTDGTRHQKLKWKDSQYGSKASGRKTMKVSMGVRNHFYCMPFHLMAAWFTSQKGIGRETNDRTSVL